MFVATGNRLCKATNSIQSDTRLKITADNALSVWGGQQVIVESASQITLNGGGSTITLTPGAIIINGPSVNFGGRSARAGVYMVGADARQAAATKMASAPAQAPHTSTPGSAQTGRVDMPSSDFSSALAATQPHTRPSNPDKDKDKDTDLACLIYVPEDQALYAIPTDMMTLFDQEVTRLQAPIDALAKARAEGKSSDIEQALQKVDEVLTLASMDGVPRITEVWGYHGRKYTYVRSKLMKNHFRRYRLDTDVRDGRKFTDEKGHLSRKKLRKAIKQSLDKLSNPVNARASYTLIKEFNQALIDLQPDVGHKNDPFASGTDKQGLRRWVADAEAQLLRYAYGASVSSNFNAGKGFSVKLEGHTELVLAQAQARIEGWLPNESGHQLTLPLPNKQGRLKVLNLGAYRLAGYIQATGYAGAKLQLTLDSECTLQQGRLMIGGVSAEERTRIKSSDKSFQPSQFTLNAFAGIRGAVGCEGALQWDNPEERKNGNPGWCDLARLGVEGHMAVGAGFEHGLYVYYERDRFVIRGKASLVWGVGAGGDIGATVHVDQIYTLIQFIYHQLKENDYDYLAFIHPLAFETLYRIVGLGIQGLTQVTELAEKKFLTIKRIWKERMSNHEIAMQLAENIVNGQSDYLLKFSVPEIKGAFLHTLTNIKDTSPAHFLDRRSYGDGGVHELRERAIIEVLSYTQSLNELHEILEHMGPAGTRLREWREGDAMLRSVLDGSELDQYDKLTRKLLSTRPQSGPVRKHRMSM